MTGIASKDSRLIAELRVRILQNASSVLDQVYLSPVLWDKLLEGEAGSSKAGLGVATISLYPADGRRYRNTSLPALTFHAVCDPTHSAGHIITVSPDVSKKLKTSGTSFSRRKDQPQRVHVQLHTLLTATTVYLAATSSSGFELAQTHQDDIVQRLDGRILRQDDSIRIELGSSLLPLRVIMTEPLLQAVFSADSSQVLLTVDEATTDDLTNGDISMSSIFSESSASIAGSTEGFAGPDGDDLEEDEDDLSIDERFLEQTVLEDFSQLDISVQSSQPSQVLHHPSSRSSIGKPGKAKTCNFQRLQDASILEEAISAWRMQLASTEVESLDEENVILATERDLACVGAFNGDWVVATAPGRQANKVVRIMSSSRLPASDTGPELWMPPVLAQNILGDHVFSTSDGTVLVRVLGTRPADSQPDVSALARTCPVPIPFADSLTIARIAGPLSVDRAYQGLFLEALRTYFEDRRRICRSGDIIAVAIEASKARFVKKELEQETPSDSTLDDIHDLRLPSAQGSTKSATVFFKVSEVRSELVSPAQLNSAKYKDEGHRALVLQAQIGALGCIVDANVTKMVQTGVEQCRVIDCERWLGVVTDTPDPPALAATRASALTDKSSPYSKIRSLLDATLQENASRFGLHLSVLLKGARGAGKRTVVRWIAKSSGVQLVEIDCFDLVSATDARTEGILRARFQRASECAPCILLLRNIEALARKSQALETGQEPPLATALQNCFDELWKARSESAASTQALMPVAVFGTTSDPDKCPTGVLGCFKHEVSFNAPNEAERREILEIALKDSALSPDVDLKNLATQTAALVAADLVDLVSRARFASVARVRKAVLDSPHRVVSDRDLMLGGMVLTGADFDQALAKARSSYSESIGAPKIPNVTWDDVGGLASVKSDILDTIQLPLEHPELFSDGLKKRSGILLYGPPGTGKTLLAKAVATSCSLNFFSVKGPELLNMYIGESEANVRRVFQRARDAKPCVIFFDELDSVAPKRGNQGDSGGVMDRIVSQLLAELDGMAGSSEGTDVFVIGATNRPDLLDPALLRPGRFDRMLYLSVSETHQAQLNILQALTRKFKLDPDVGDLSCIAEQCPFNLTGADFYALCSDAMLKAMTRKAGEVDARIAEINKTSGPKHHPHPLTPQYYLAEMAKPEEIEVKVNRHDFEQALKELTPSVSEQEMQHYREVQAKFSAPKKDGENEPQTQQQQGVEATFRAADSMRDRARKAIAELGYSIQPPEEKPKLPSQNNLSPSRLPQPIRKSPSNASLSPSEVRSGSPNLAASADGASSWKGKGKGKAAENEPEIQEAESRTQSKGKGKARE